MAFCSDNRHAHTHIDSVSNVFVGVSCVCRSFSSSLHIKSRKLWICSEMCTSWNCLWLQFTCLMESERSNREKMLSAAIDLDLSLKSKVWKDELKEKQRALSWMSHEIHQWNRQRIEANRQQRPPKPKGSSNVHVFWLIRWSIWMKYLLLVAERQQNKKRREDDWPKRRTRNHHHHHAIYTRFLFVLDGNCCDAACRRRHHRHTHQTINNNNNNKK